MSVGRLRENYEIEKMVRPVGGKIKPSPFKQQEGEEMAEGRVQKWPCLFCCNQLLVLVTLAHEIPHIVTILALLCRVMVPFPFGQKTAEGL